MNTDTQLEPSSFALEQRAAELGAIFMVPPVEYDTPLREDEIVSTYGEPVIEKGINFTSLANQYLYEVSGIGAPDGKLMVLDDLTTLIKREHVSTMETNCRLLIDHDSKAHRKAGIAKFDEYVELHTGRKLAHSTIFRRITEAKVALIFAAQGAIDILPSQAICALLGSLLPRTQWVKFWRQVITAIPTGKVGKDRLLKLLEHYCLKHRIPCTGQPLELEDADTTRIDKPLGLLDEKMPHNADDDAPSASPSRTRVALDRDLLIKLARALEEYFPASTHKRLHKKKLPLPRRYLTAIRACLRAAPSPAKLEKCKKLYAVIESAHPDLATQISDFMMLVAFELIDQKAFK